MKKMITNKKLGFGVFLVKKLKDFFESYDNINKGLIDFGTDYRMSAIMGSGPFYYMF